MIVTVNRSSGGVGSVTLVAVGPAEEDRLCRLAEAMRRADVLALRAGGMTVAVGPFGPRHSDQLRVIDATTTAPPPMEPSRP